MLGRKKKRQGSVTSVDLLKEAVNIPVSQPADSTSASAASPTVASSSSSSGRAFNYLVERARGAVSFASRERARTTSDETSNLRRTKSKPLEANEAASPTGSVNSVTLRPLLGKGINSEQPAARNGIPFSSSMQEIAPNSKPTNSSPTNSAGGFFRRNPTLSLTSRPGWLTTNSDKISKASVSSPLTASPSSPSLSSQLGKDGSTHSKEKKPAESLKRPEKISPSSSDLSSKLRSSSQKSFSRSVEDLSNRRQSRMFLNGIPPLPSLSRRSTDELTNAYKSLEINNNPDTNSSRQARTTSLSPQMAFENFPSPKISHSPASSRAGSPRGATSPRLAEGTSPTLEPTKVSLSPNLPPPIVLPSPALSSQSEVSERKRDSQIILLQGFLQRKGDFNPASSPNKLGGNSANTANPNSPVSPSSPYSPANLAQSYFPRVGSPLLKPSAKLGELDLQKGWKPYRAVLRGTKLYLHRVPTELNSTAKQLFPNSVLAPESNPTPEASPSLGTVNLPLPSPRLEDAKSRKKKSFWSSSETDLNSLLNETSTETSKNNKTNQSKPYLVLTLSGVQVIPYENSQRSFVFQLKTEDGQISLFQATNSREFENWIAHFEKSADLIASRRATFLAQTALTEETDEPIVAPTAPIKPKSKSSALFAVPLRDLFEPDLQAIPQFVETCLHQIEARGLNEIGIYRISGENRVIQETRSELDRGASAEKLLEIDVHNVTGLFKLFLRELPEPLIPFNFYQNFIQANSIPDYDERLYAIRDLTWNLPRPNFIMMKRLCEHLDRITDNEDVNAMHAANLSIIFAPTLLKPEPGPNSFGLLMTNLGKAANIVKSFILQQNWIFGEHVMEEEQQIAADSPMVAAVEIEFEKVQPEIPADEKNHTQNSTIGLGVITNQENPVEDGDTETLPTPSSVGAVVDGKEIETADEHAEKVLPLLPTPIAEPKSDTSTEDTQQPKHSPKNDEIFSLPAPAVGESFSISFDSDAETK